MIGEVGGGGGRGDCPSPFIAPSLYTIHSSIVIIDFGSLEYHE